MRSTYARLWEIVRPVRWRLFGGLCVTLVAGSVALIMPQLLSFLVNELFVPGAAAAVVIAAGGIVAALGLLEASLVFLRRLFNVDPATRVEYTLRTRLFARLVRLPLGFHDSWESGQLLSRAMSDLTLVRRWLAFNVVMLVNDVVMIVVGVALMWTRSPALALAYTCGIIPCVALVTRMTVLYHRVSRLSQDQAGDLSTNVEQSVHGIRVLKAFGRGEDALADYGVLAEQVRGTEVRRGRIIAVFDSAAALFPEFGIGVALLLGLHHVADGTMSIGDLSAFFATAMIIAGPVAMLGNQIGLTASTAAALERHFEVVDAPITIADAPDAVAIDPDLVTGDVEFDRVRFAYPDAPHHTLLHSVSLRLLPGETMALVGITGTGKSTLLQLVPRLYDITGGSLRIDGVDVREWRLDDLRRAVAIAFEDATLFSGTVRENVLLGADASLGVAERDELLDLALTTADAEFIARLPDGVDTVIGEQGLSLSGGQRQRISLARAIAAQPRVLLLDDPLSALDTATEERVTARLREVLRGTTTLVVAHRTSTVALADRVALLADGVIVAVGTHEQLMATDARYRAVMSDVEPDDRDLEVIATDEEANR